MSSAGRNHLLLLLAVLTGALWQLYLVDDGLGTSWPQNVVRNWQEFGFFNLHGQLVQNPGGWQIHAAPDIYKGMSPVCLWPAYAATEWLGWTGLGTLAFHLLLALAVFWAIWDLLGRDNFAFFVAAVAILTPGYDRWQKLLDPNALSVLLSLPYAAMLVAWLKKPRLGVVAWTALIILTLLFISLNWTTAWVLAPLVLLLLGLPQVNRRSLGLFVLLAGIGSVLFVGVSAAIKAGGGSGGHGNLRVFLASYLWGSTGYGEGLTSGKAFGLLTFTNVIGLLTLWLLVVVTLLLNLARGFGAVVLAPAPLALALLDIVVMRNYFGHHPWMAAPVLLAGMVFSLALLRGRLELGQPPPGFKGPAPAKTGRLGLLCAICFFYGVGVVLFLRANEASTLALVNLIRHHTDRSDTIVIVARVDPQLAQIAGRMDEVFDRHVVLVDNLSDVPRNGGHAIILSGTALDNLVPVAHSGGGGTGPASLMRNVSNWFNRNIARRKAGDRLELADAYFLYEPKP